MNQEICIRPAGRVRWMICALLFLATTINYIDRQILSLLKPMLDVEIGWTNEQFGVVNAAFQFAYAVSLLFFGWFIDRFGTKIGYAVSIGAWSLAAMAHAIVASFGGFLAARVALGLGEGGNFPAAVKTVGAWFPKRERALATTLFNSGANVGAVAAPLLVPLLASTLGWQSAFLAAGLAGFLWLLLWIPLYSEPGAGRRVSSAELSWIRSDPPAPAVAPIPWAGLLRYRQTWSFIAAKFLTDPVWWFFLIWLPDFFKKTRGLDIKQSWVLLVAIYSIVTVLSIGGGWLTGWFASRGWSPVRARKVSLLLFAAMVLPIATVNFCGDWMAVALIGLAGAAHQAWSANLYTSVSDMFPNRAVASVTGIGSMAGSIGGILFPIIAGILLDRMGAGGYGFLFAYCAAAYLVAFALNHLLAPRFAPVENA